MIARAHLPVLAATASALLFGLWWIPIRVLETMGLPGAWASLAVNGGAAAVGLTAVLVKRGSLALDRRALAGALLAGMAAALYSMAISYTDVARAILLFYLVPAWSKLIEWAFWRVKWRWPTTVALLAALTGALLVLGGRVDMGAIGYGDLLALVSGLTWAAGAALIFAGGRARALPLATVLFIAAAVVTLPFALVSPAPAPGAMVGPAALGFGAVYAIPLLLMLIWSAQRVAPAALSFLLTGEILSGVVSSAILLDEPLGAMQMGGAALIMLAAASEILSGMRAPLSERR